MTQFIGEKDFQHNEVPTIGVLLVNMGTPDAPTPEALRPYLKQFLSDPRVIEYPRALWWLILNLIVLNTRPKRSARLYAKIWTDKGSPLLINSRLQKAALESVLQQNVSSSIVVELGMRYGNPSIESALERLRAKKARRLLVLPLYPQYSGTTTASGVDAISDVFKKWRWIPEVRMLMSYHDDPLYISALVESVRAAWNKSRQPEKLLMSFHGIPKRYFTNGDPYYCHCQKTGRLVAEGLGLKPNEYQICFQSLFGREEWLKPYTSDTLKEWGRSGIKSVDVMCPGFTSDCIETIEEIDVENREYFEHAGGKDYRYIPALNDSPSFVKCLESIVVKNIDTWLKSGADNQLAQAEETEKLFKALANS